MSILIDTNVLLRLDDTAHVHHADALAAIEWLNAHEQECVLVPQVIYEFWVVATRPLEVNGLGLSVSEAELVVSEWMNFFSLRRDERGVFDFWHELVQVNDVKGKNAHDARLVAAMRRHGITNLLTFNVPDFLRYSSIRVFAPADVLAGRVPV